MLMNCLGIAVVLNIFQSVWTLSKSWFLWIIDCRSFAGGVCGKLSEMLDRTSVPLDIKLKLVSIFEHMWFDPDNYEKVCFVIFCCCSYYHYRTDDIVVFYAILEHTHTYDRLTALCPELPGWASTRRNIHPSFINFLHLLHSIASSLFNLCAWQSSSTTSLQVLFGLPLGLGSSTGTSYSIHFFTQSSSFHNMLIPPF